MIKLYRHKTDEYADEIQNQFEQLVLAYELEYLKEDEQIDVFIKDGEKKIEKGEPMEEWLRQLEKELTWQRSISGDGCYIDPDTGKVC